MWYYIHNGVVILTVFAVSISDADKEFKTTYGLDVSSLPSVTVTKAEWCYGGRISKFYMSTKNSIAETKALLTAKKREKS